MPSATASAIEQILNALAATEAARELDGMPCIAIPSDDHVPVEAYNRYGLLLKRACAIPVKMSQIKTAALRAADHEIVAMDHLGASCKTENNKDIGRGSAFDLVRVFGVIGDQAAPNLGAVGPPHDHRI